MLTNDTDRTAWYAEPYDDRLQHVLLHPAFEKDTHKRARPRPECYRRATEGVRRSFPVIPIRAFC